MILAAFFDASIFWAWWLGQAGLDPSRVWAVFFKGVGRGFYSVFEAFSKRFQSVFKAYSLPKRFPSVFEARF